LSHKRFFATHAPRSVTQHEIDSDGGDGNAACVWSRRLLNVTSTRSTGAKAAPFKTFKIQAREQTAGKLGKGAIYEKIA
jgi:hypothetical protein